MNIITHFVERARQNPNKPAIVTKQKSITYAELELRSRSLAAHFRASGLSAGDIVLLMHPLGITLYSVLLGLFRLGAVAMFTDPSTGLAGAKAALRAVRAKALCGNWKAKLLKHIVPAFREIPLLLSAEAKGVANYAVQDVDPNHAALITFTSGSTGEPKGIGRSHEFLLKQHEALKHTLGSSDSDIDLISFPVFVLSHLGEGVTSVLPDGDIRHPATVAPEPILRQLEKHGVNRMLIPPVLCQSLAATGCTAPGLRKIFTGGGPVFPNTLDVLAKFAPAAEIISVYGSTEAEPIAHISSSEISEEDLEHMRSGSGLLAGRVHQDIDVKIVDDEILVSGEHVVKGYLNPDHDLETKVPERDKIWHRTGDAGRFDEHGRLWLLGRKEASSKGHYPFCYEAAALSSEGVRHAAFANHNGKLFLVVETHPEKPSASLATLAKRFPELDVVEGKIPLDKRHNSKVNYAELRKFLAGRS